MDRMDRLRELLQERADETGETWLMLDGFRADGRSVSNMSVIHGVPKSDATPQELAQAIEEVRPR